MTDGVGSGEQTERRSQCAAEGCDEAVDIWVEFGSAPVTVGMCDNCGKEVV